MHSSTLTLLLYILPLIAALTAWDIYKDVGRFRYPWLNMTLNNLESICHRKDGASLYSCTIQFDFYDYNTEGVVDVSGARCNATWQWDGITHENGPKNGFPSNNAICWSTPTNIFMFKVVEFRSASNFEIYVSHLYQDSRFFQPPWNGRKAMVEIKIPDAHPIPPFAPFVPPVDQFEFIATATISKRTDGLS